MLHGRELARGIASHSSPPFSHFYCRAAEFGGVKARTLFKAYTSGEEPGNSIKLCLLVQVDDEGRAESHFRFALEGEKQEFDFWSEDIFTSDKLAGFGMKLHLRPEDIAIRQNSTTSKWENLEDLVARGDIIVTLNNSQDDHGARFREAYEAALEEDHELGAAVRWAVLGKKRRRPEACTGRPSRDSPIP